MVLNAIRSLWWVPQDPPWFCTECTDQRPRLSWASALLLSSGWGVMCRKGHVMYRSPLNGPWTQGKANSAFGEAS